MAHAATKEYSAEKIRNIALIGHGGSGKTSLTEAILFTTGTTNRLGKVEDGSTTSDYHHDEIERQISINASFVHADWQGNKLNILDTPGYSDFTGEVLCSLRVVDAALLLIKAVEGPEVGSEIVWNYTRKIGLPVLFAINKIDHENTDFDRAVASMKERFGNDVTIVQFPLNPGFPFDSIVDVLKMKMYKYERDGSGKFIELDIPEEVKSKADSLHEELMEKIAESDEKLLDKFVEEGTLPEDLLSTGFQTAVRTRKMFPIYCGSASLNIGVVPLLNGILMGVPSPKDRGEVIAIDKDSKKEVSVALEPNAEPSLFVFKTVSEQHVGGLSYFKVYSGTISAGMDLINQSNGKHERLGQIFLMNGKNRHDAGKLVAGDIGAVVKLKDTHTNNTLSSKSRSLEFNKIEFPEPVIRMAIVARAKGDEDKISTGLHSLHEEDPTFGVQVDGQLSQTVISGQGELHLLVMTKRLKDKYGVEVDLIEPKIPFKETIRASIADSEYKHKKQTGGRGQFGHVHLKIEPRPRGGGFEFVDAIVGGVVPGRFVPAVEKGVIDSMTRGILAGYEVVDVRVTLFDGSYHTVDSDELSFKLAGSHAFRKGFMDAKPVLLEPIYEVEVTVPDEYMGDVMGDISGRRGKILGMEPEGSFQKIKSLVPMAELHKYSTILRSMTQGRGIFRTKYSHYDELPREQAEKVIAAYQKAREAGE